MPARRKPLEQKRVTARSATKDDHGRPLPDPANLVSLPGCGGSIPVAPSTLAQVGLARWEQIWSGAAWLSPAIDQPLVRRICEAEDIRQAHKLTLSEHGSMMVEGSQGQMRLHPSLKAAQDLDEQITRWEAQLGLTPVTRGQFAEVKKVIDGPAGEIMQIIAEQVEVNGRRG